MEVRTTSKCQRLGYWNCSKHHVRMRHGHERVPTDVRLPFAFRQSVTVKCNGRNLTSLPMSLPRSKGKLELHVEDNSIQSLDERDYLRHLTGLYASRNSISDISEKALKSMSRVSALHLDANKLQCLPRYFENMTRKHLMSLNIKHNFFICDCHVVWMKYWLRDNMPKIVEAQNVLCSSDDNTGKPMIYVPDNMFTCALLAGEVAAVALATVMFVFIVVFTSVYKRRQEVKVLLYAKFNWHPFDRFDRDEDNEKIYDAFISYCSADYRFVCHNLRVALEQNDPPYRLCIHDRDFLVGAPIYENVMTSVRRSKRMVMVLSDDFLKSEWCMVEFRTAHQKVLKEHSRYLIVVILGDIEASILDDDLKLYLKTNTYLTVGDKLFWERLRYALPKPRLHRAAAVDDVTRV